jgi:hypothetical protein
MGLGTSKTLPDKLQRQLLRYYNSTCPTVCIVDCAAITVGLRNHQFLNSSATFHNSVILDGRRIQPSISLEKAPNVLVQLDLDGTRYVGPVFNIITHLQVSLEDAHQFLDVRWLDQLADFDTSTWDP